MTLTEFLLARIAEDEEVASRPDESVRVARVLDMDRIEYDELSGYARLGIGRVLAECEAKRRIVAQVSDVNWGGYAVRDTVLGHLALPYADHEDYRPEWKP